MFTAMLTAESEASVCGPVLCVRPVVHLGGRKWFNASLQMEAAPSRPLRDCVQITVVGKGEDGLSFLSIGKKWCSKIALTPKLCYI